MSQSMVSTENTMEVATPCMTATVTKLDTGSPENKTISTHGVQTKYVLLPTTLIVIGAIAVRQFLTIVVINIL